jgi:hypothetical protein
MKAKSMKARVLNVQGASARMAAMGHEGAFPRQGRASAIGSVNGHSWDVGQRTRCAVSDLKRSCDRTVLSQRGHPSGSRAKAILQLRRSRRQTG